jgi:hypothetical protein
MVATARKPLYCDCCGNVVMGYVLPDGRISWYDERHGKRHIKVLEAPHPVQPLDLTDRNRRE